MNVMRTYVILSVFLVFPVCLIFAESFVIKKKKKPSLNTMREQCCEQLGDVLQQLPLLIREITHVQEKGMHVVDDVIRGQKGGLLKQKDKETLCALEKKMNAVYKQISLCKQELHALLEELT